jgi:tRNA(fMet)-specific endonuclease VapC
VSYLLDTNIVSTHLRRPSGLMHRFIQHSGRLAIPTIVLGELYAWAYGRADSSPILGELQTLLTELEVLDFDADCAEQFGRLRVLLLRGGITVDSVDLMIASVALAHGLTVVTDNTKHFVNIPGLSLENWLTP